MTSEQIAKIIVEAELQDNWCLADMMRPQLRIANKARRMQGLQAIAATQHWYFDCGGCAIE